jgi:hypothetical protein
MGEDGSVNALGCHLPSRWTRSDLWDFEGSLFWQCQFPRKDVLKLPRKGYRSDRDLRTSRVKPFEEQPCK